MNRLGILLLACPLLAAGTPPVGFPFSDEALTYSIVWPSGLSLGEGKLSATHSGPNWTFELALDAAVPGYTVKDTYRSTATVNLCSSEFERQTIHGVKKVSEKTTFSGGTAVRKTVGGGQSEIAVPACAHDALTFLFMARRELGQGKVPQPEKILFGGAYQLQLQYTGAQNVPIGNVPTQADRVFCTVTVRETQKYEFEVFFARDAARTPLLIRVPFALGAISMELVR
jgi:Protein of unknown function (DUF3108)